MLCLALPGLVELEVLVSGGVVLVHKHANVAGGGAAVLMMVDTENRDSVVNILLILERRWWRSGRTGTRGSSGRCPASRWPPGRASKSW